MTHYRAHKPKIWPKIGSIYLGHAFTVGTQTFGIQGICRKKKDLANVAKCLLILQNLLRLAPGTQSMTKAVLTFLRITGLEK